jgi:hypothetical protein
MGRDDWKYDEDSLEDGENDEKAVPPAEKQCAKCLHWVDREALYCPWCGRIMEERRKR